MRIYNRLFDKEIWDQVNQKNKTLLGDFIMELKALRRSPGTIKQYRSDLTAFFCYVYREHNNQSVLDLTRKDFRRFSLYLTEESKVSNARHNAFMSAIRSMLAYAEIDEDLDYTNSAARRIKGLGHEPVRDIVFLTNDMVSELQDRLLQREEFQKAALLSLAYDSAGRRAELAQVTKAGFLDPKRNYTNLVIGKGRKTFPLLYFDWTEQAVKLWLSQRGKDEVASLWVVGKGPGRRPASYEYLYYLFTSMRDQLRGLGIKEIDFNVHSMRHAAITNYQNGTHYICRVLGITDGFPIEQVKLIAHHSSIDATQYYLPDTSNNELGKMFEITIGQPTALQIGI